MSKRRESFLRKSLVYGVVYIPHKPKKSFFNPGNPCTVSIYMMNGTNRPIDFTFKEDDERGYNAYTKLMKELENKDTDIIEILKFMFEQ